MKPIKPNDVEELQEQAWREGFNESSRAIVGVLQEVMWSHSPTKKWLQKYRKELDDGLETEGTGTGGTQADVATTVEP